MIIHEHNTGIPLIRSHPHLNKAAEKVEEVEPVAEEVETEVEDTAKVEEVETEVEDTAKVEEVETEVATELVKKPRGRAKK